MESRMFKVYSPSDGKVALKVIPGHFVTSHSHITHYMDMTMGTVPMGTGQLRIIHSRVS